MSDVIDAAIKRTSIKKQECFSELTEEEQNMLADLLQEKHFAPGDTIVTEGDFVDSVYLIVNGTADVCHIYIQNNSPHIKSIATLGPGDAIGLNDTGFYSISGVRTATVIAKSNIVTLCLSIAAFHGFALVNSHVLEVMRNNAEAILDKINNR
ncbi:MAG: hypothetical protein ACD_45C00718G0004 [uncultured bacterium]|nr:MAG: hypothetical protein ACD_45C00718G0004 [uncultured bacterium]